MATVTKGRTFVSGEVVTPTKLNTLVDSATVTQIVNADVSATAAIVDTKLATISTAGKVSNSATTATSANTANAIVARDASGNFSAGTITANLTGNASTATTLQTARTIAISGDVTGTATSFSGGANITIASAITADSIVNADINSAAAIADTKLATISTAGKVSGNAITSGTIGGSTAINTSGTITSGTITAATSGTHTGPVVGNASTATSLQTARAISMTGAVTATGVNFDGSAAIALNTAIAALPDSSLATITTAGKVSGNAITSGTIGGSTAINTSGTITSGTITANLTGNASTATALQTARTIAISGDVTGTATSFSGGANITIASAITADSIVNADINSAAAIADTKLATISSSNKVSNSATTATSANTASAIVARDASGNFSAGTITATAFAGTGATLLVPTGAVMPFAMNSAPSGWLAANGTAVSRTTYSVLFGLIGITYGVGDGVTTFNLPDLRGYFVRGAGTNSDLTAAGTFGAKQEDALKSHTHSYSKTYDPGGTAARVDGSPGTRPWGQVSDNTGDASTGTSTETRPRNIAMLYCIKS